MDIERSWVYLANLEPRQGSEPGKTRPVLVLQTDLLNGIGHPSTIVIPLTARVIDDAYPLRVRIAAGSRGFRADSDILIDQIRAIDNRRLFDATTGEILKRIAPAPPGVLEQVEDCLKHVLDLKA